MQCCICGLTIEPHDDLAELEAIVSGTATAEHQHIFPIRGVCIGTPEVAQYFPDYPNVKRYHPFVGQVYRNGMNILRALQGGSA